jgi:hypothetical protein
MQQLRASWWPAALACWRWRGGKSTLEVVGHSGVEERAGAGRVATIDFMMGGSLGCRFAVAGFAVGEDVGRQF